MSDNFIQDKMRTTNENDDDGLDRHEERRKFCESLNNSVDHMSKRERDLDRWKFTLVP